MKKLLFLVLILIAGILAYVMFIAGGGMQTSGIFSSGLLAPLVVYLFCGGILFIIVKKGYNFMVSR